MKNDICNKLTLMDVLRDFEKRISALESGGGGGGGSDVTKEYVDTQDENTLTLSKSYTDSLINPINIELDSIVARIETIEDNYVGKNYVDAQDLYILNEAQAYADTHDATTLQSAKTYTDNKITPINTALEDHEDRIYELEERSGSDAEYILWENEDIEYPRSMSSTYFNLDLTDEEIYNIEDLSKVYKALIIHFSVTTGNFGENNKRMSITIPLTNFTNEAEGITDKLVMDYLMGTMIAKPYNQTDVYERDISFTNYNDNYIRVDITRAYRIANTSADDYAYLIPLQIIGVRRKPKEE